MAGGRGRAVGGMRQRSSGGDGLCYRGIMLVRGEWEYC